MRRVRAVVHTGQKKKTKPRSVRTEVLVRFAHEFYSLKKTHTKMVRYDSQIGATARFVTLMALLEDEFVPS